MGQRAWRAGALAGDQDVSEPLADTTPEAQAMLRELLMKRTGEERVRMACDMFQAARRLILAALPSDIAASPAERSVALLTRMYRGDLDEALLARVVADLRARASTQRS